MVNEIEYQWKLIKNKLWIDMDAIWLTHIKLCKNLVKVGQNFIMPDFFVDFILLCMILAVILSNYCNMACKSTHFHRAIVVALAVKS